MANAANRGRETLPEFQKYLREKKLVAENRISYFAYWVSRFLSYAATRKVFVAEYRE
jgi:hypothetical protein